MAQERGTGETHPVPSGEPGPPLLRAVEERLSKANAPQEVVLWTQVRGEIQRQDDIQKDQEHRRHLEKIQVWFKIGLSLLAVVVGAALVFGGFAGPGLFVLGAGLYALAPDYVKSFFRKREGRENE